MTTERERAGEDVATPGAVDVMEAGVAEAVEAAEIVKTGTEGYGDRPALRRRTSAFGHGPTTTVPVIPLWDRLPVGVC